MGGRGRRHKNTECFSRRVPPVAFCLLCRRGQSRSPAGEISLYTVLRPYGSEVQSAAGRSINPSGQMSASAPVKTGCQTGGGGKPPPYMAGFRRVNAICPDKNAETQRRGGRRICMSPFLRAQRRSGASHKVLCQAFFQESERLPGRDTATAGAHIKSWKNSLSADRGRRPPQCGGWAPHRWNRW